MGSAVADGQRVCAVTAVKDVLLWRVFLRRVWVFFDGSAGVQGRSGCIARPCGLPVVAALAGAGPELARSIRWIDKRRAQTAGPLNPRPGPQQRRAQAPGAPLHPGRTSQQRLFATKSGSFHGQDHNTTIMLCSGCRCAPAPRRNHAAAHVQARPGLPLLVAVIMRMKVAADGTFKWLLMAHCDLLMPACR